MKNIAFTALTPSTVSWKLGQPKHNRTEARRASLNKGKEMVLLTDGRQLVLHLQDDTLTNILQQADDLVMSELG